MRSDLPPRGSATVPSADPTRVRTAVLAPVDPLLLEWLSHRSTVAYYPHASDLSDTGVPRADVLVVRSNVPLFAAGLNRMRNLRLVLRVGSGTDNIDRDALADRGIVLVRTGGDASAPAVAELALQATVALLRHIPRATTTLLDGRWCKHAHLGGELSEATVGVWGAGPVGRSTAALFDKLGADVRFVAHPSVPPQHPTQSRDELCRTASVHVFALPLAPRTRQLVNTDLLARMAGITPQLVNVGRWELMDMPAVLGALAAGGLGGVAVDPVDREHVAQLKRILSELPMRELNLQLTPHLGAMTEAATRRAGAAAIAALESNWPTVTSRQPMTERGHA